MNMSTAYFKVTGKYYKNLLASTLTYKSNLYTLLPAYIYRYMTIMCIFTYRFCRSNIWGNSV